MVFLAFLWIGFSCSEDKGMMLRQLEALEQANRDDSLMTNDSLAETLVAYFDKHGSANERMRARYMLGRTYYDLGELPHALETFLEAADCADTLSSDCDYAKLSRVRAQMALIYESQVLPWSQLKELRMAEYYANRAGDTIQAIECYSQQAGAYEYLKMPDSIIIVMDNASEMFAKVHRYDRSAQVLAMAIIPLIDKGKLEVARKYINIYEKNSGFFDEQGNILKGRQIYYYIKGYYYLAVSKIDSAEMMFRKELREASTLNHLIAGSKGLQEVYSRKGIVDSVAKYANLGYELNDSAYSLSEMQNIQKLSLSYNYNHAKLLAEKNKVKAERLRSVLVLVLLFVFLTSVFVGKRIRRLNKYALDYKLKKAPIVCKFRNMANASPCQIPTFDDWISLRDYVERSIPSFSKILKKDDLSDFEYDICLMTRVHIMPIAMAKLKQCSPSYISNIRKRIFSKIKSDEGNCDNFDEFVKSVC